MDPGSLRHGTLSLLLLMAVAETWSADPPPIPETRNKHLIRPFSQNRRGFMGPGRSCPGKEVAVGFKMRMQPHVDHDNTALNAVRLICSGGAEVISSEGEFGEWTDVIRCQGDGDYISGVKIKTEEWRGWDEDDLGAVDFEAVCSSGIRLLHHPMHNWVRNRGRWSRAKMCPQYAPAVCGIKSRVDGRRRPRHGKNAKTKGNGGLTANGLLEPTTIDEDPGDKVGLTEIQLKCCEVVNL